MRDSEWPALSSGTLMVLGPDWNYDCPAKPSPPQVPQPAQQELDAQQLSAWDSAFSIRVPQAALQHNTLHTCPRTFSKHLTNLYSFPDFKLESR